MREIYAEYQCLRRATVLIQSYYKGYCQRKSYLCDRQKVVLVQSSVRMHLQRTKFLQKRSAVIAIQCRYRSFIIGQDVRQRFRQMKWAANRIQVVETVHFSRMFLLYFDQCQCPRNCTPTPQPNINPNLFSVDCCWVRGGVGAHFLRY